MQFLFTMAKNTSILLGDYFDSYIHAQIKSGRYASASEVIREALRLFEQTETQKAALIEALIKGEGSGFILNFERQDFLQSLHHKYPEKE